MRDGKRGQLAITEAMSAMLLQRYVPVASFHSGTTALKQVRTFRSYLFQASAFRLAQRGQWTIGPTQRSLQFLGKLSQTLTLFRLATALRCSVQTARGN